MDFSVTRTSRVMVRPCEPTPMGTLLLSPIDSLPALRCNARTLHVFKHGPPNTAEIIRQALSRALVPYYPLAGRLVDHQDHNNLDHELQIECPANGVWFVEASTNSTLHALNFLDDVISIAYDRLLPDHDQFPEQTTEPLVQMQVTQFACGGFLMGLIFCHSICDGLGAAQFLNAVAEHARGLDHLSVEPIWHRDFFPPPPPTSAAPNNISAAHTSLNPPFIMPNYCLEQITLDIPIDQISQLKHDFRNSTGRICSTFEIIAATFWAQRTRAINLDPRTTLQLVFFANSRQLLDPPLPKGFYGNCFFPVTVAASSAFLSASSNADVVKLIQEAKSKLPSEFGKYLKGEHLRNGEGDPFTAPIKYTTLFLSEWGRLGFNQVDYGWGPPVDVIPIQGSSIIPVGIMGSLPLPKKGIRLMTWCVEESHRQSFLNQMVNLNL